MSERPTIYLPLSVPPSLPLPLLFLGRASASPTLTVCLVLGAMVRHMTVVRQFWPPGCWGPNVFALVHITRTLWLRAKWLPLADISKFPCGVLKMIMEQNDSSSPILPTTRVAAKHCVFCNLPPQLLHVQCSVRLAP